MIDRILGIDADLQSGGIPTEGLEIRFVFPNLGDAIQAEKYLRVRAGKLATFPTEDTTAHVTISGIKITFAARGI